MNDLKLYTPADGCRRTILNFGHWHTKMKSTLGVSHPCYAVQKNLTFVPFTSVEDG